MALPQLIKELLENGVHFGHLSKHWNPKMKAFIFGKKKNVYIIDLEKTANKLQEAKEFLKDTAKNRQQILFVATKRQLRNIVKELASSCAMPYVSERWIGGLLTNFATVRSRVNKYLELIEKREKGKFDKMVKKEVVRLNRDIARMHRIYSGVTCLESLPDCLYVVDPKKETACIREARKLSIPIVALIDTDADPGVIDYPVPGNDDSIRSVKYITSSLVEAINEGLEKADSECAEESEGSKTEEVEPQKTDTSEKENLAKTKKKAGGKK